MVVAEVEVSVPVPVMPGDMSPVLLSSMAAGEVVGGRQQVRMDPGNGVVGGVGTESASITAIMVLCVGGWLASSTW